MSASVALIGFPRLQEQLAARMLAELDVQSEHISHDEAGARLAMFNLALYFWPDGVDVGIQRLKAMRALAGEAKTPILIVASHTGQHAAQKVIGEEADGILLTPLQPHDVTQKLAKYELISKPKESSSVDADFINSFVSGTVDTMKRMAGIHCERVGLHLAAEAQTTGYYLGTIELSGNAEGSVSVAFSKDLAAKIAGKMLSMPENELTEENVRGGVGEFMNVVTGAARADLVNTKHAFHLSLPQVFSGGPHTAAQPRGIPVFVIEFKADGEPFDVLVCLRQRQH